nr:TraI/MobA(P) family conjugative relaxase [Shinella yambaruensis]
MDPRSWERTADYILDMNAGSTNDRGEKVGGIRVSNCATEDPAAATLLIEQVQAMNTRSKNDKTYHLVFSFPPGETPALDVLNQIEDELCASIGYADHQRISAVHVDTDHLHVHVAINKVHPTGFQNIEPYFDKRRLMETCERLEVEHGLQRTNHGIRDHQHERPDRDAIRLGPEQRPDDRDSRFRRYLRESHNLQITDRPEAETLNGLRNLSSSHLVRTASGATVLLPGDARSGVQRSGEERADGVRRARNGPGANDGAAGGIGRAAKGVESFSGIETLATYVSREIAPSLREAKTWQQVHDTLAEHGLSIKPRGAGLVIGDDGIPLWVRASQCSRDLSMKRMTDRLGPFEAPTGAADNEPKRDRQKSYTQRPVHQHPSSAQLFAQYQRERQEKQLARKQGMAIVRKQDADYYARLGSWRANQRLATRTVKGTARKLLQLSIRNQAAAAKQKHKAEMKKRREQLYNRTTMPNWADWLIQQAEGGNEDALAVLRSRAAKEERIRGDLMTAEKAEQARDRVLAALKPSARRDGAVTYRTIDGGMVIDRRTQVQAQKATTGAAFVALTLAAERFTGQPLIVEGTDQFRSEVAKLAALHKVAVTFADPVMEKARQEAMAEQKERPEAGQSAPKGEAAQPEQGAGKAGSVVEWIESRNKARDKISTKHYQGDDKISTIHYHRLWQSPDAGSFSYEGRRKMKDGSEVLLLKGKAEGELLVKPVSSRVAAKASKWKIGSRVEIDARGRFIDKSRAMER